MLELLERFLPNRDSSPQDYRGRHRRAEVISTQALPVHGATQVPLQDPTLGARSGSFIGAPLSLPGGGGGTGSFVSAPRLPGSSASFSYGQTSGSFCGVPLQAQANSFSVSPMSSSFVGQPPASVSDVALGRHLPTTPEDSSLGGRGLYVPVQRGFSNYIFQDGVKSTRALQKHEDSDDEESALSWDGLRAMATFLRPESPGRMKPASRYVAAPEDPIDEALAAQLRQLPLHMAEELHIRRIAPGEYEFDGLPAQLRWCVQRDTQEVIVIPQDGSAQQMLNSFLWRVADVGVTRAIAGGAMEAPSLPFSLNTAGAETRLEAMRIAAASSLGPPVNASVSAPARRPVSMGGGMAPMTLPPKGTPLVQTLGHTYPRLSVTGSFIR